ncbi:rifamycin-inactivating phosphotransferase [Raineyella sp. LH-20]|uniref:rifamycin-inactivating phosphotransferase n=1 Tax=Raineyella sp. LH-20 TaxID=3081204 RepID=UPI0029554CDD|nr:rifamycin-inactivating phosphotransferase [Raineyella sp. LH-20]WOP20173.1 rifamycin-inactivating phosphotransferase [Raineyella sp. LH-20]
MTDYVVGFEQIDATMLATVGGKGANLGELSRLGGVRVPDGFCVTTDAYAEATAGDPTLADLVEGLSRLGVEDAAGIREAGTRIRKVIEAVTIPTVIADAIRARLAPPGGTDSGKSGATGGGNGGEPADATDAYAVRSSATAEDLPTASFAGQQDTYLNVSGADAVLRDIRRCWASLFTDRAISYRLRHGIDHRTVRLAVVVQRMFLPEVAGIMFTADPLSSDRRTVSIDAGFGLGEALVSGLTNADNYTVREGRITGRRIADQALAVSAAPDGGTVRETVDPARRDVQKLADADILRLAGLGRTIEAHFGSPQDIEWAYAGGTFFVVQSRPITTLFPIPGPGDNTNHLYMSFGHQQMMTDAMTPLGLSFFQLQMGNTPLVEAGGRFFIDMAPDLASPVGRRILKASLHAIDPLIDSAVRGLLRRPGYVTKLARGGPRFFSLTNNAGYFTWRLPVEAIRLYRRNDPGTIPRLTAGHEVTLDDLQRRLADLSGDAVFDAVQTDVQRLGKEVTDAHSMAVVYVGMYALSWVNRRMKRWLGVEAAGDALSQSVGNDVTSTMGLALLDVADAVRSRPAVLAALPQLTDATFFEDLAALDGGEEVGRVIRDFLTTYGMRCSGEIDITRPRWSEAPSILVPVILSAIRNLEPDARTIRVERSRREAEELEQSLLDRLRTLRGGRRKAARTATMISRLRNFAGYREYPKYLMMRHYWVLKHALTGEAAGLVADAVVERPDDVYFLTVEEFREAVRTRRVDSGLIARRRAEHQAWARLTPPRVITSDGEVPPGSYDHSAVPAGALVGIAASAGTVEGRARIIRDLPEAHLEEGDILVTTFTDPSWTPVFLSVKGVVTEVGGAGTHGAVVAREYGLPAVVGVEGATRLISDGRRIRVNGTDGYVELL